MVKLVVMCDERKAPAPVADRSADHLFGSVLDILPDDAVTDHYYTRDPFLVVRVDSGRDDIDYLLDPLIAQAVGVDENGEQIPPRKLLRRRYGLRIEKLSEQKQRELFGTGYTSLSLPVLESIVESRSAE